MTVENTEKDVARIYDRIVDALKTRYIEGGIFEVIQPVYLDNIVKKDNLLIQLNKGSLIMDDKPISIEKGSFYFIPAGKRFSVKHGAPSSAITITSNYYSTQNLPGNYLRPVSRFENQSGLSEIFSMISFDASLYEAASFFNALDVPPIQIPFDEDISFLIRQTFIEQENRNTAWRTLIENYIQEIVIQICRYIHSLPHLEKNIERVEYLLDKRIVDIILYVQNNLDKDLSNKSIASIAYVSEDYVGQFFKTLTGRNLQDYIEDQRLESALQLLRTSALNIQEIARSVGFKDPAYFSRRFKHKFGENANAIRNVASYVF